MEHMTAAVSCFARAYHYRHSLHPVFADSAAKALLGNDYDEIAAHMTAGIPFFLPGFTGSPEEGLQRIVTGQLAPSVLIRSAFSENLLHQEIVHGCRQVVIPACGYDTFGIRNTNTDVLVFELDLPELIEDKQRRIRQAGLSSSSVYIPCDLSSPSWKTSLQANDFRLDQSAFCSLLGISYYLEKEAFRNLLQVLNELLCKSSSICFDYPSDEDGIESQLNRSLARGAGEEMKARYSRNEMEDLLSACGFQCVSHIDCHEATKQFCSAYNESCPAFPITAPSGVCYMHARNHKPRSL